MKRYKFTAQMYLRDMRCTFSINTNIMHAYIHAYILDSMMILFFMLVYLVPMHMCS